jgi:hypothetical protein
VVRAPYLRRIQDVRAFRHAIHATTTGSNWATTGARTTTMM